MLTRKQIIQMQTNTVLKPEVLKNLILLWDSFSSAKQAALSELLGLAEDAHRFLLQRASERNVTLSEDLNNFVTHRISSAIRTEEAEDRTREEDELEKLIQNTN